MLVTMSSKDYTPVHMCVIFNHIAGNSEVSQTGKLFPLSRIKVFHLGWNITRAGLMHNTFLYIFIRLSKWDMYTGIIKM